MSSSSRRRFLQIAGSSAVILAAGSGAWLATRRPAAALEPWQSAGENYRDPRLHALSYAILAPNPHNRQPWIVDLKASAEDALLFCDTAKLLPETDPFSRQIVIGLGCFLETARIAAAQRGVRMDITPFPQGSDPTQLDDRPVAGLRFVKDETTEPDPLFAQILKRRSTKEPFDMDRPLDRASLDALRQAAISPATVGASGEAERVEALRELTWRAFEIETRTPRTHRESIDLMRIGRREIEASPDGIDLGGPFLETLHLIGQLSRESLADPASSAYEQGFEMYREMLASGMAYMWIATSGNSRQEQLQAGRDYVRLNLKAAELGIAMHPISQALQEYPEMHELYGEAHQLLVNNGDRVQMLARLGHAAPVPPSPRWPLEEKLRSA